MDIYEHYFRGEWKEFNKNLVMPIRNVSIYANKPMGGFWASRKDAAFGWKDFYTENYGEYALDKKSVFIFSLADSARVLKLETVDDIEKIKQYIIGNHYVFGLNFESMIKDYDALEINAGSNSALYNEFYGWDCDSIVIFNPNIIKEKKKDE